MIYQTLCQTPTPIPTEEWLWTLPGVQAVEHSIQQPGLLTVFSAQPVDTETPPMPGVTWQGFRVVQEADWAESWKKHWHVTPITPTLTIRPSWEAYQPQHPDEVVLSLDPGTAFGTGAHETTRLMLTALDELRQQRDFTQTSVLDVGTGSGILAIASALFGSRQVMGQDIDPAVLPVAATNAALNQQSHVGWTATLLPELCLTRYDLVLANILAPVIVDLMPELLLRVAPDGLLLASGIIRKALPSVEGAAKAGGFARYTLWQDGDWCAIAFARV